jgi:hypothetical protein
MPSFTDIVTLIDKYHLGELASISELLVALVGFGITIFTVLKSKTAAEQTKEAVTAIRRDINRYDTVSILSSTLADMEEIKRLHRQNDWEGLLGKYSAVRRALTSIKASNTDLNESQKSILTGAIQQFVEMEQRGERALAGKGKIDPSKLNRIVTTESDKIHEFLIEIKNQMGR